MILSSRRWTVCADANPEDRFSRVEAQLWSYIILDPILGALTLESRLLHNLQNSAIFKLQTNSFRPWSDDCQQLWIHTLCNCGFQKLTTDNIAGNCTRHGGERVNSVHALLSAADFFKINFFENLFQKCHQSVKQFGSRSGPTFCRAWSWSKPFA